MSGYHAVTRASSAFFHQIAFAASIGFALPPGSITNFLGESSPSMLTPISSPPVHASKPLVLGGKSIENFGFRFEKGKVVEVFANEGKEMLESLVKMDENAGYLGEVALVEYHSPISMSNVVYYTTLIDENASCHLALGRALHSPLPKDDPWTFNESVIHIDFMVGTSDLRIVGTTEDGREVTIFEQGDFAL